MHLGVVRNLLAMIIERSLQVSCSTILPHYTHCALWISKIHKLQPPLSVHWSLSVVEQLSPFVSKLQLSLYLYLSHFPFLAPLLLGQVHNNHHYGSFHLCQLYHSLFVDLYFLNKWEQLEVQMLWHYKHTSMAQPCHFDNERELAPTLLILELRARLLSLSDSLPFNR